MGHPGEGPETDEGTMELMRDAIGWLSVLLAIGGAVLSALHMRRTTWAVALAAGFGMQAFAMAVARIAIVMINRGETRPELIGAVFLLTSLLGLVGSGTIVAGVAGVLSELKGSTRAPAEPGT